MRHNGIAIGLLTGFLAAPALAQTAIEQNREDVISNVMQIQDEMALRNYRDGNVARIGQFGSDNAIEINQTGQQNLAGVEMTGNRNGSELDGSVARVTQTGAQNFVSATVLGDDNSFEIGQGGVKNTAVLSQTGGSAIHGANTAEIYQYERLNVATVIQKSVYAELFPGQSDNDFSITQNGRLNNAAGEQIGAANSGEIVQTGNRNSALLGQYGGDNDAVITQEGNGLFAESLQYGNNTSPITIHQTSGALPVSVTRYGP